MQCITMDTNVLSRATGQYKKFNFNSMMKFNGKMVGTNPTGMFILEGKKDSDLAIEAWIKTGITDLGVQASKRLHTMYLTGQMSGDLQVEVYADEVLVSTRPVPKRKVTQTRTKVKLGSKRTKGQVHAFLVRNVKGSDFAIDTLGVLAAVRHYGHI